MYCSQVFPRRRQPSPLRPRLLLVSLFLLAVASTGCSDRATAPTPADDGRVVLPPDPNGMELPGEPQAPALEAIVSLQPSPAPPAEIEDGRLTTRIRAVVDPDATVAEVNAALEAQDAAIVSMEAGMPTVTLIVPALATEQEAAALAEALAATEAFLLAAPARAFQAGTSCAVAGVVSGGFLPGRSGSPSADLPAGWTPAEATPFPYFDLMALVPTWKTRPLLQDRVRVVLADAFGSPPEHPEVPGLDWDADGASGFAFGTTPDGSQNLGNRGFHHAGIIGAGWEGSPLVGIYPDADILGLPLSGLDMSEAMREIIFQLDRESGPQVLVTPIGFSYHPTVPIPLFSAMLAAEWRFLLRATGLEDEVLHISSAGDTGLLNGSYAISHTTSPWNLAATYSELIDYVDENLPTPEDRESFLVFEEVLGIGLDLETGPVDNVIIVGGSGDDGPLSTTSLLPHMLAPGERIAGPCEDVDPGLGGDSSLCDGTTASYTGSGPATAIVGGLAAYLWNLAPGRSQQEIRSALEAGYLRGSAYETVDAYHAVLALDLGLEDAPVREILLDVTGDRDDYPNLDDPNGIFDEKDLKAFLDRFDQLENVAVPAASDLRFDLNGDDNVGFTLTSPFDLDGNTPPRWERLSLDIGGQSVEFDEESVSDLEVLCYYAYSNLYLGDTDLRDLLLADCSQPTGLFVRLEGVPRRVAADEAVEVTVVAGFREDGGGIVLREGVEIDFELDGADADPRRGVTDEAGTFRTTITFRDDENDMTVGVWAESEDEEAYAEQVARRHNEIEMIRRTVYVDATVFATYNPEQGVPSERFIEEYVFHEVLGDALVDTTLSREGAGARAGMAVSGTARTQARVEAELESGAGPTRFSLSSESEGSITLQNPNFDVLSYQVQSEALVDISIDFIVWGDGASYSLNGFTSSEQYEVDLEGPDDDVFECDSNDAPCGSISSQGQLPPGEYDFSLYHENGGFIRWFDGCQGCVLSGTQSSSGSLDVTLEVTPLP